MNSEEVPNSNGDDATVSAPKEKNGRTRFSVANVQSDEANNLLSEERDELTVEMKPHRRVTIVKRGSGNEGEPGDNLSDAESHQLTLSQHGTMYLKSLRHYLTKDALPSEHHYRNLLSISEDLDGNKVNGASRKFSRPTLEELRENKLDFEMADKIVHKKDEEALDSRPPIKGKAVKFGWIKGVFMRCLLNIWGVMLFLRLSWVVGQCGIVQGILVITLCNIVTVITTISMSAVSTNGIIKGGGIYYMISRSLGPEFGGAIGIMFTIANSIAVATYLIGFCDSLIDMVIEYSTGFEGIVGSLDDRVNDVRLIGTIALILILVLAIVGMEWVTRVQIILLFLLIGSQLDFIIGSFFPAESEKKFGFVGYSSEVLMKNLLSTNYHSNTGGPQPGFFDVFGVFFPAVTGIVAGANLSGDLKDPATAIPKGTLAAIGVTFLSYITYGFMIGSCYLSEASGIEEEYQAYIQGNTSVIHFNDCEDRICDFGSSNDQQTLAKISYTGYLVYAGCFAATLSSAIASLVGAPRVLQALANDNLYPLIGFFGKGYGGNNDPFRGYILVFFIAFGCTMIGNLDLVSSLLSNFFVAAYALINFSVFHSSISKSPGWRPSFKYYNEWVSLLGTLLCVAVMFLMDWVTAILTFVIVAVLYFYISYRKPEANWGSSAQAQQFLTTLKNLHALGDSSEHVKNYRPKILVFSGIPRNRIPLVDFANLITKKISLLICAHIDTESSPKLLSLIKRSGDCWLRENNIRAFFATLSAKSLDEGGLAMMNLVGLGRLSPNMILLGFKQDWFKNLKDTEAYITLIHHGFDFELAVGILRLNEGCDYSEKVIVGEEEQSIVVDETQLAKEESDDESSDKANEKDESGPKIQEQRAILAKKERKVAYYGLDGQLAPQEVVDTMNVFKKRHGQRKGTIDVWWLYDDGGLTLLLPYILSTRAHFAGSQLRVFALANKKDELDRETRNMAALLSKFRIDYHDVTVIPDVTTKAKESTRAEFEEILRKLETPIPPSELSLNKEKTNRNLRITEAVREHSKQADMVVMTLPMLRKGAMPPGLYMSWLEIMTRDMPPFLLVRGNQTSVLTFYS